MRIFTYRKLKHSFLIGTFFMSSVVFGQWTVYDGNAVPMEHTVITFDRSNVNTGTASSTNPEVILTDEIFDSWWSVHPDDEKVGNNFVQFVDPDIAWRGMYRVQFPEDNIPEQLTLVARIRAVDFENTNKAFDIDFDFNGAREQVMIHNHTVITDGVGNGVSRLRLRRGSPAGYHTFPEAFDLTDWHIFRFVMDTRIDIAENIFPTFKVYVDEEPIFAQSLAASGNVNNRFFRFGNSEQALITKFDLDWLLWDVSGAYAPGEGTAIPDIVSSINTPKKSIINANVVSVDYINIAGISMGNNWERLLSGIYIVVTTYDNGLVTTEKILKTRK